VYARLVRAYHDGHGGDAVAALASWPHADVLNALRAATETFSPADRMIAAILHADTANTLIDDRPVDAMFHVGIGLKLVESAGSTPFGSARSDITPRRWYYFMVTMMTSAGRFPDARRMAELGLLAFPGDAHLYLARGTVAEMSIQVIGRLNDLRGPLPESSARRTQLELMGKSAVNDYDHALNIDPHLALASLHKAWLRMLLDYGDARPSLESAAADADSDTVRYLAHLFLGGVAERQKRIEDATREYTAAFRLGAGYQSACVALSHVEESAGQRTLAHDTAEQCATLSAHEDPWWDFRIKFDRDALYQLRAEARRP